MALFWGAFAPPSRVNTPRAPFVLTHTVHKSDQKVDSHHEVALQLQDPKKVPLKSKPVPPKIAKHFVNCESQKMPLSSKRAPQKVAPKVLL